MRPLLIFPLLATLAVGQPQKASPPPATVETVPAEPAQLSAVPVPAPDIKHSVVRINSTMQSWSAGQPWEKDSPRQRRALAVIVGPQRVLTTSELVADATYLELETPDGDHFAQAKVISVDYEANLAVLGPASEAEGNEFFAGSVPLEIASPPAIGDALDIVQVEENGQPLQTQGALQSIDITSNFLPGHGFLTYMVKASMQSAASSFSLPVLREGKLAGVLSSYNSKDQICDVVSTDIVARFVKDSAAGRYTGFPSLGIATTRTEDLSFRQWLQLAGDQGGLYIRGVRKGGSAEAAGVQKGDVLLAVDQHPIDRRGYYQHPRYGSLLWGHLIRGERATGDTVTLSVLRAGKAMDIQAKLQREEESDKLVPGYTFGQAPNFLVKGGFVFQELTVPLLEAFGENWESRAPLPFLDALANPEKYEGKVDRIVFLSGSIPTPATVGYESLRNLIVSKVNGKEIKNMKGLIDAFATPTDGLHSIEFDDQDFSIYLDDKVATEVDAQLKQRGISRLSRAE